MLSFRLSTRFGGLLLIVAPVYFSVTLKGVCTSTLLKFLLIVSPLRPKLTTLQCCFPLLYFKVFLLYQLRFIFGLSVWCFSSCLCVTTFTYMLLHMSRTNLIKWLWTVFSLSAVKQMGLPKIKTLRVLIKLVHFPRGHMRSSLHCMWVKWPSEFW